MIQAIEHLNPDTLSAFIDGELPDGEQEAIQQHLAGCHACALRVLSATELKAATARAGRRFAPPPGTLARLTAQLHREPRRSACIPLHSSGSLGEPRRGDAAGRVTHRLAPATQETNTLAAELLDQHLSTLSSAATPQVISSDRHTVKPWFQGRLPFSFNLTRSSGLSRRTRPSKAQTLPISKGAARCVAPLHYPQTRSLSFPYATTVRRSQFSRGSAKHPLGIYHPYSHYDTRPPYCRRQRRQPHADLDALVATLVQAQSPSLSRPVRKSVIVYVVPRFATGRGWAAPSPIYSPQAGGYI